MLHVAHELIEFLRLLEADRFSEVHFCIYAERTRRSGQGVVGGDGRRGHGSSSRIALHG